MSLKVEVNSEDDSNGDKTTNEYEKSIPGPSKLKRRHGHPSLPTKKYRNTKLQGLKAHEVRVKFEKSPIQFCQAHGLIATTVHCSCGKPMKLSPRSTCADGLRWNCRKRMSHSNSLSVRKGTWFEKSKLPIQDILWIAYMWVHEYSYNSMLHECGHTARTLIDWCGFCRDVCQAVLENKCEPIGGDGKMVEIFECKFDYGTTKFKKENEVHEKSKWIFIALEQFSRKSVFAVVSDNESDTVMEVIESYILSGTTLFTNVWNAFKYLSRDGFLHLTQDLNVTFCDTTSGTHIGDIECLWNLARRPLPCPNRWNRYVYDSQFCEYMYRKLLAFAPDAYIAFLEDVASVYKPPLKLE